MTNTASQLRRFISAFQLGIRRLLGKLTGGESTRLLLSVTGIAVAIMLLTTVSGVAVGLASQTAVQSDDVDYWIVPEDSDLQTIAVSTGGPQLGETHPLATELTADDRVTYATPVLLQVVPVTVETGTEYILFVGVVPSDSLTPTISGLPTAPLTPGDPYYANGSYAGNWTGEMVINPATAELLNASTGDQIAVPGTAQPISITTVADGQLTTGVGSVPVALVHLSELQQMTRVTNSDAADQILVSTNVAGVKTDLDGRYPNTTVVTRTGIASQTVSTSSLPLAMAAAAFVTALVVGVLFTATMMGLEVSTDRTTLGTLTALGYSGRSLTVLVIAETLSLAVVGGILGVGLGGFATVGVNILARRIFGVESLAVFEPALFGYGLAVAFIIGLCAAPYPVWLSRQTDPLEVIRR